MRNSTSNIKPFVIGMFDIFHYVINSSLLIICWYLFYRSDMPVIGVRYNVYMCVVFCLAEILLSRTYGNYMVGFESKSHLIYSQTLTNLICLCGVYAIDVLAHLRFANPLYLLAVLIIQFLVSFIWVVLAHAIYFKIHKPKTVAIIYRNESDLARVSEVSKYSARFNVTKTIENPEDNLEDLFEKINDVEVVFVAGVNATLRNAILKYCVEENVQCYVVPHVGDVIVSGAKHVKAFSTPILQIRRAKPSPFYLLVKRLFDIVVSVTAIVIFSVFMLFTALAIKLYDKGPVLYKQVRLTKDGKEFKILKFRSMRVDAEKDGVARLATDKDDRITPIGKVIRAIRFDELPQLFNILKGDMTIVGPRPERPEIAKQYYEVLPSFKLRLQVKAGLTGYAQVYGKYNTEPYEKLEMDLMYINKMSVLQDLAIMFATIKILFLKESTSGVADGNSTAMKNNMMENRQ